MSTRWRPAHLLVFDHPFRNQGIDRGFRQTGRNATPRSISRAIIDKRQARRLRSSKFNTIADAKKQESKVISRDKPKYNINGKEK